MRAGARNLILLALFISSSVHAYNGDAWPSTNKYRIANPASYFQATNLWSLKETARWTQTSTTNSIPELTPFPGYSSLPPYTNSTRSLNNVQRRLIQADVSTNTTLTWTNQVGYTNVTAFGSNSVETILIVTQQEERIDWGLDVPHIWAWDTYTMLAKRYQILNPTTNAWNPREAAMSFKPKFYYSQRENLEDFKTWAASAGFVDKSKADSNGTLNAYFSTPVGWRWHIDYIFTTNTVGTNTVVDVQTNDYWIADVYPTTAPIHDKESITLAIGGPFKTGTITIAEYTAAVPGWFANNTNEYEVTNYTFTATVTGAMERTWFDYTPYRDLGGWGQGLSNPVSGRHEISVWASSTAAVRSLIYDTCGNPFVWEQAGSTNASGSVTSTAFKLMQFSRVQTNAYNATTGTVTIPAPFAITPNPATAIYAVRSPYTNIVTNLVADVSPTNVTTNVIASSSYNTPTVVTNLFTCELSEIAPGSHEREYGYKHMPAVLSQLVWTVTYDWTTVVNTSVPPDWSTTIGSWSSATSAWESYTNTMNDPTGWYHIETNATDGPRAFKFAAADTNDITELPRVNNTNDCSTCDEYFPLWDKTGWAETRYILVQPGDHFLYQTKEGFSNADYPSCDEALNSAWEDYNVNVPWHFYDDEPWSCFENTTTGVVQFAIQTEYAFCENVDDPRTWSAIVAGRRIKNGPPCDSPVPDFWYGPYYYHYERGSQYVIWTNLATNFVSDRDEYYRATNPVKPGQEPDNESFFTGALSNKFSRYGTTGASVAPTVQRTDFDSSAKPFAGDAITNMGWQINGGLLIQKWDFGD